MNGITFDADGIVALVGIVCGLLGAGLGEFIRWLASRHINKTTAEKNNAEAADLYEQMAARAAERALKLDERIVALEKALDIKDKRIDELEAANDEKDKKIAALQCEVDELRAKIAAMEDRKAVITKRPGQAK